jgi:glycosyltransferase involved in cell wall biosynthesis
MRNSSPVNTICFIGNFLPRKCGIATFTADVCEAVAAESPTSKCFTIAMNDIEEGYDYPERVRISIAEAAIDEYKLAAEFLNVHHTDVVSVQHEYGIYGGIAGEYLFEILKQLSMPVVTTLHTVLQDPNPDQKRVLVELCRLSDRVVVMSERGQDFLENVYGIPSERIVHIPHGIPDVSFIDPTYYKDKFGALGKRLLLTFGLLSPGKGIELAIQALPDVVELFPDTKYVILGATHPGVIRVSGESYRESLVETANKLGVGDYIEFINKFVSLEELREYLCASDIFITPYPSVSQITSGTLAYAVGTGNAVVSTPYWYAEELLSDGRGRLFPFGDAPALSAEIRDLLEHPIEHNAIRKRAYEFSRKMTWPNVARNYMDLFEQVRLERETKPHRMANARPLADAHPVPEIRFEHLQTLTDDTGLLQHALFTIPDRQEGYCSDDNARALVVAALASIEHPDQRRRFKRLATRYLTFIEHAMQESTHRFRNFMTYGRHWLDHAGSEDCHGRCLSGVGYLIGTGCFPGLIALATRIFDRAMPVVENFTSPRAWAYTILGILSYLERFKGDLAARRILIVLAERLLAGFAFSEDDDWSWPEAELTYANGIIPHALIAAGSYLERAEMVDRGMQSLDWLIALQIGENGQMSLLGNREWYRRGGPRARFDQQPIEAQTLLEACAMAFLVTDEERWMEHVSACLHWFTGINDLGVPLYDPETGGCRDGLQPNGPNANEGAESTLAWLQSALIARRLGL